MVRRATPALLLAIGIGLLMLVSRPLLPVDETRYLSVAWEMWLRGDFIVPHKNFAVYVDKPPMLFWLMQAGWAVFGVNEWWPRLIPTLAALASLLLTGFSQPESATYVSSVLQLLQGATLLEEMSTTVQTGATFATQVQNGVSYTVKVKVRDSNGLWSDWASSTFDVAYLPPVPATVTVNYLQDTGFGQVNLLIPAAGAGEAEAATFTITREIAGVVEDVVRDYPVQAEIAILDTTPVVNGANLYRVTTRSALGAEVTVTATLTTAEKRRAFLSKGPGFATVGVFGGNLDVDEDASVAGETVVAAGRAKPIGLYGTETSVKVKVKSFVFEGFGSTLEQLRDLLLIPGQACYRDPSGRRVFGVVDGSISRKRADRGDFSFTLEEAD